MSNQNSVTSTPKPMEPMKKVVFNSNHLYSGAIAGVLSRTLTAPLERIKILNQIEPLLDNGTKYNKIIPAFKTILKEEGFKGLFKGNGTNVLKAAPQSAIRFYTYEAYKKMTADQNGNVSIPNKIWAGASAGVTSVVFTYPLEVIKTRLSIQIETHNNTHQPLSNNSLWNRSKILSNTKLIYREDGFLGFFRGLSAGILNIAPFAALNFTFYEIIKEKTSLFIHNPPFYLSSIYGALAGTMSMTILYPLDVVKRRIMLQNHYQNTVKYRNFLDAIIKIIRNEGVLALYSGIKPAYLKVIPTVSINFLCYEGALELFKDKK
ncbi:transmembrane protein [Tieghemostelium lacteum]|uniref:Transmembrane protein n=1 Tax=Tieghemostelium lacteum TaxID=361077 RepID=A0A151ZH18_TIELA|nr:transmembrane protein [Tieghemostelium lacteum]|eukprot:KYQ93278.1 transmembrane protein [Tieghemostelium lacteum]